MRFKRLSPEGPRTLIAGFYGQGNLGDEAMLEGMLVLLRDALGPFRPVVLSAQPADTELRHGVTAVALQDGTGRLARVSRPWRDLRVVTARCENFVLGGGDLLRDDSRWPVAEAWLARLSIAQRLGKRSMVLGVSVGEIWKKTTIDLLRRTLHENMLVVVRDEESKERLRAIGVEAGVEVHPDLALFGQNVISPAIQTDGVLRIGLSVRTFSGRTDQAEGSTHHSYVEGMGRVLDGLVDEFPEAEIHLLPLRSWPDHYVRTDDDYVCSLEVAHAARHGAQAIAHRTVESVSELAKVSRSLGLLIGTRLHSLVVAAANDVPIIGISYDSKVDGFMRANGQQESVMTVADLSPSRITARSRQLLHDPVTSRQTLSAGLASYRGHSQGLVLAIKGVLGTIR